jgi:LuxR family transcriptional regulator, maltose regulon positive regulatory protein
MADEVGGAGGEILLATKLHVPARQRLIDRPGLAARLGDPGALPALTLVDAPAGWGKTTLLAQWHAASAQQTATAWLAIDRGDNDPSLFWTYAVASLQTVAPGVGQRCRHLLRAPDVNIDEIVLPLLLNELDSRSDVLVAVWDDFHLITSADIHAQVDLLLKRIPPSLRIVVATRADPPLSLGTLRARGQLQELRMPDLRFSASEATSLLNGVHDLALSVEDVTGLLERTEGWAAGLHLAALSLRDHPDVHRFVRDFTGDDRHIVDFLGAEVLAGMREPMRQFLLRTSVLDRLCAPLCEAVTGNSDAGALLDEAERANLFLLPLDTTRRWYRFHHLFGKLLGNALDRADPALFPVLHHRAAAWYRDEGLVAESVRHSLAAGDVAEASQLIGSSWSDVLNQGRMETVDGWLRALPGSIVEADPRLCLARAGVALTLGRRDEVDSWVDAAERRLSPGVADNSARAEAAILRAVHRYMLGDFASAAEAGLTAVGLELEHGSPWAAMAFAALGRARFWQGRNADAVAALSAAIGRAQPPRNNLSVIAALGYVALLRLVEEDVEAAESLAERALRMAEEPGLTEHWVTLVAHVARGRALLARGKLVDAETDIERAVELARRGAGSVETALCLHALADLRTRQRAEREAANALRDLGKSLFATPDANGVEIVLAQLGDQVGGVLGVGSPAGPVEALSERELSILRLLPGDLTRREIGRMLHISENTVKTHMAAIYRKLLASDRRDAVERSSAAGLL